MRNYEECMESKMDNLDESEVKIMALIAKWGVLTASVSNVEEEISALMEDKTEAYSVSIVDGLTANAENKEERGRYDWEAIAHAVHRGGLSLHVDTQPYNWDKIVEDHTNSKVDWRGLCSTIGVSKKVLAAFYRPGTSKLTLTLERAST